MRGKGQKMDKPENDNFEHAELKAESFNSQSNLNSTHN